jgi:hypothetical protein
MTSKDKQEFDVPVVAPDDSWDATSYVVDDIISGKAAKGKKAGVWLSWYVFPRSFEKTLFAHAFSHVGRN